MRPTHWKIYLSLWFTLFFSVLLSSANSPLWGDPIYAWRAAERLLDHGTPYVPPKTPEEASQHPTINEKDDVHFPFLYTAINFAPLFLDKTAKNYLRFPGSIGCLILTIFPAAVSASLGIAMAYLFVLLGASLNWALLLSLVGFFSTPLWTYARNLYSENPQALVLTLLAIAFLKFLTSGTKRWAFFSGTLFGIAINLKYSLVILAAIPAILLWRNKHFLRFIACATLAGLPWLALVLWYNYLKYGSIFETGYEHGPLGRHITIGFHNPLTTGLFGLLFSPGKSLFLYAPLITVGLFYWGKLYKRQKELTLFLALTSLTVILTYAKWYCWSGDWAWGPRLIVPVFPLLLAPLALFKAKTWTKKMVFAGTGLLGILITALGNLYNPVVYSGAIWGFTKQVYGQTDPSLWRDDVFLLHYIPDFSPILAHWWYLKCRIFGLEAMAFDYPWATLGVSSWMPDLKHVPLQFDYWFNYETADIIAAIFLVAATCVSGAFLARFTIGGRRHTRRRIH